MIQRPSIILYLKFIGHVLLVERIKTDKFKTFCHDVEGLVVSFRTHCHLISANLQKQTISKYVFVAQTTSTEY